MNLDQTTNIQKRFDRLVELNVRDPGINIIDMGKWQRSQHNIRYQKMQNRAFDVKTGKEVDQNTV